MDKLTNAERELLSDIFDCYMVHGAFSKEDAARELLNRIKDEQPTLPSSPVEVRSAEEESLKAYPERFENIGKDVVYYEDVNDGRRQAFYEGFIKAMEQYRNQSLSQEQMDMRVWVEVDQNVCEGEVSIFGRPMIYLKQTSIGELLSKPKA